MKFSDKIRFYRTLNNLSRKELGIKAGFSNTTAAIRISQYENGQNYPKAEIMSKLAAALNIDISALENTPITTQSGLIHTLFDLEGIYDLRITKNHNSFSITFNDLAAKDRRLHSFFDAWYYRQQLPVVDINSSIEYDLWKGQFPLDLINAEKSIDEEIDKKYRFLHL